jgi:hypothetical protein
MSNSSQPQTYSTTLNDIGITAQEISTVPSDTITLTGSYSDSDIITLTSGLTYTYSNSPAVGLTTTSIPSLTINDINPISFNWGTDFVDKFPEWSRIKSMCDQYPSLEIALRNFETIYQLVKDDYDNPTPKK